MDFSHKSVLLNETIEALAVERGGVFVDGTLGGGGHAEAILQKLPFGRLIGIDRDGAAIEAASKRLADYAAFTALRGNYADMVVLLDSIGVGSVDGVVLDLGVSSFQLDTAERGFSYNENARLDMRMDERAELSAYEVVNGYAEAELARVISRYGEERWAKRIAQFIAKARRDKPLGTTFELNELIKAAIPASARREGPHPSKRTFQAIRIEVNGELALLEGALRSAAELLNPKGRMAVITFHSLEDRIVKQTFRELANPCICDPKAPVCVCGKTPSVKLITRKAIAPTEAEVSDNPRSRSAHLRAVEKL